MPRGIKLQEQIVIGTPGTMLDWCTKLKFIDPKKIKVFVLDEADVMIATQGHQDHSIRIQRSEQSTDTVGRPVSVEVKTRTIVCLQSKPLD